VGAAENLRRTHTLSVFLALPVLLVVASLAGCGGSKNSATSTSKNSATTTQSASANQRQQALAQKLAYERQMQKLGKSLGNVLAGIGARDQNLITDAGAAGESTATIGIVKNLELGQRKLREAATELAAMNPPPNVKADHEALRRAVLEYAQELSGVIAKVKKGSIATVGTIASLKGVLAMQKASQAITAKGYVII
jgi:hypothetical protein